MTAQEARKILKQVSPGVWQRLDNGELVNIAPYRKLLVTRLREDFRDNRGNVRLSAGHIAITTCCNPQITPVVAALLGVPEEEAEDEAAYVANVRATWTDGHLAVSDYLGAVLPEQLPSRGRFIAAWVWQDDHLAVDMDKARQLVLDSHKANHDQAQLDRIAAEIARLDIASLDSYRPETP